MAVVKIDYSELKTAAKRAKNAADYYNDFADDLNSKVYKKLDESKLSGSDSAGNIASARSSISSRIQAMRKKKDYYSDLSDSITTMKENIENHEGNVVKEVRKIATAALELDKRSKWEAFCQWLYGTFCVDLTNLNPITRALGNLLKSGLDWVQKTGTKVVNWFKHGEGRYILDIVLSVAGVIAAIAATVAAVALAIATGGAAIPLVVAAVASVIATVLTVVDTVISVVNDIKALKIMKDTGDPGQARFYGNIDDVGELTKRRDFGGAKANKNWETFGVVHDVTREVAGFVATVAGAIGSAGLSANKVKDPVTGKYKLKTEFKWKNVIPNLKKQVMEKIGMKKVDGKWKFDVKRLFTPKKADYGAGDVQDLLKKNALIDYMGRDEYNTLSKIEKYAKKPGKIKKSVDDVTTLLDDSASGYDKTKSALKIVESSDFYISEPVGVINDHVIELIDKASELKDAQTAAGAAASNVTSGTSVVSGIAGGAGRIIANDPIINPPHTGRGGGGGGGGRPVASGIVNDPIIDPPHTGRGGGGGGGGRPIASGVVNDPIIDPPHTGRGGGGGGGRPIAPDLADGTYGGYGRGGGGGGGHHGSSGRGF